MNDSITYVEVQSMGLALRGGGGERTRKEHKKKYFLLISNFSKLAYESDFIFTKKNLIQVKKIGLVQSFVKLLSSAVLATLWIVLTV